MQFIIGRVDVSTAGESNLSSTPEGEGAASLHPKQQKEKWLFPYVPICWISCRNTSCVENACLLYYAVCRSNCNDDCNQLGNGFAIEGAQLHIPFNPRRFILRSSWGNNSNVWYLVTYNNVFYPNTNVAELGQRVQLKSATCLNWEANIFVVFFTTIIISIYNIYIKYILLS